MEQPIVNFEQDDEGHWVALLACGHKQHVRHDPPLRNRAWVLTESGRQRFLGAKLTCKLCVQEAEGNDQ